MKKIFNTAIYAVLLAGALAFTACQEEFEEVNTSNAQEESFQATSSTAQLMEKTAYRDGSFDNIVDGSSCFALNFPYTVNVNGLDITVDSMEDLRLIEEIFDEFEDDEDILEILFPITITLADHSEITINNKEELIELARQCIEGGGDDDIECIDFVYPITLFTFDINNQQTGRVTVNSDRELKLFFEELDDDDFVSIDYPVTLIKFDGTEIQVSSNAELAAALEMAKDACDEDDDNDYNDDDFDEERLANLLTECPWVVLSMERNSVDQTGQYEAYLMTFKEDGSVRVRDRAGNVLVGQWDLDTIDGYVALDLSFDTLVDFTLEWKVYQLEEGKIKLFSGDGNRIIMRLTCEDPGSADPETLRAILAECNWIIKKVKNQGEEIRRLVGYEFTFMAENMVTLSNGTNVIEGTWEVALNSSGILVLAITMGDEPGVSFEWPVRDLAEDRLRFEVDAIGYEMVLERVCLSNTTDGDVVEISNILMAGDWVVAEYTENGSDPLPDYEGYDFTFGMENELTVRTNMDPLKSGFWRVVRDSDGSLKVYLNLGDDGDVLSELTDDWDFVSISENNTRLELKDISGDETVDTLVFVRK
ncbi:MAG: hypothetical protein JSW57_11145 [Flavobacteriaceae bacterium]|jgi:hypothetical protein|nr:MAG: hypothetical protein JSW57_11145 [Flavobacteriaceae bacterium]